MFETLNNLVESGVDHFQVDSFDSCRLLIVGSLDLCYYHNVEVEFADVAYISCPTHFFDPTFRIGVSGERERLVSVLGDFEENVYCIDASAGSWPQTFFIVARSVVITEGMVYRYARPDLKPGERIAPWVKPDSNPPSASEAKSPP